MKIGKPPAATAEPPEVTNDLRAVHGGLLLALLTLPVFVPQLRPWPWYLLAPLSGYAAVVCLLAPLRRTVHWLRVGRLRGRVLAATAAVIAVSTFALLVYDAVFQPHVGHLARQLPLWLPVHTAVAGALFSVTNALLEELIFRGVLLDSLASQVGVRLAVAGQALAFGVGHANGYPPGTLGVAMASAYGLMLGVLRLRAGGLLAPWVTHVFADATIFWIVLGAAGR